MDLIRQAIEPVEPAYLLEKKGSEGSALSAALETR